MEITEIYFHIYFGKIFVKSTEFHRVLIKFTLHSWKSTMKCDHAKKFREINSLVKTLIWRKNDTTSVKIVRSGSTLHFTGSCFHGIFFKCESKFLVFPHCVAILNVEKRKFFFFWSQFFYVKSIWSIFGKWRTERIHLFKKFRV